MNETKSQAVAEYGVRAREPLPPNESAPVPFRVSRAGRIVDVVDLPPNVAVVQARLGRVRYSREEMKTTFAEFLALEPQEVKAGTYCVFTVMNVGTKPVMVAGSVIIEGEHGEAVQGLPLREATEDDAPAQAPAAASRDAARRNPASDAMVDAIIDNATMADGTPVTKARPSKSKSSKSKSKSQKPAAGRRPSPTPTTAPMPRAGAMKPQKIMTSHARRQRYEAEAAATAAKSGLAPHSSPLRGSGEETAASLFARSARSAVHGPLVGVHGTLVALLHIGHVAMLDLALSARIPLGEDVRGEIGAAIREASADATANGVGVVAIHFADVDCERLSEAIDARAEFTLDDTEAMCAAIQQALDPKAAAPEVASAAAVAPEAELVASAPTAAETSAPPFASVEKAEAGNVTPISTSGRVQQRAAVYGRAGVAGEERGGSPIGPSGVSREERGESLESEASVSSVASIK